MSPGDGVERASAMFYGGAAERISRFIPVAGVLAAPLAAWWGGMAAAAGLIAGAAVSWVNFRSLAAGVNALASRITRQGSQERGRTVVIRFLLRYALVGMVAYAILKSSTHAFRGFLSGLCLPVAAMMAEAVYEVYAAYRRGY